MPVAVTVPLAVTVSMSTSGFQCVLRTPVRTGTPLLQPGSDREHEDCTARCQHVLELMRNRLAE
jgi:hypothetical protein